VEGVLGRGAMGVVFSARHLGLEQLVAIKLLSNETAQTDSVARERFVREARLAARIRSEHVCRVLDTGALEDATPYLVMEYLEGSDLAEELARRERMDAVEATRYMRQACEAVSVAHAAGVIHRDLKPANLFLSKQPDGSRMLKVLDFGVSKALSEHGVEAELTRTSMLVGSPLYMSPEQLHSARTVDERADIWALGAILYELIAGQPPFVGDTIPALIHAILTADPPRFQELDVSAPEGLEPVIRRALSKSRTHRFASAIELSHALAAFAQNPGDSASGVFWNRGLAVHASSQAETLCTLDEDEPMLRTAPQKRRLRLPLLAALVLSVLGGAYGMFRPGAFKRAQAPVTENRVQPAGSAEDPANNTKDDAPALSEPANTEPEQVGVAEPDAAPPPQPKAATPSVPPPKPRAVVKEPAPALQPAVNDKAAARNPLEIPGFGGRR
jgi:serine/threonine-protein kinase